jgi:hypothetical protein
MQRVAVIQAREVADDRQSPLKAHRVHGRHSAAQIGAQRGQPRFAQVVVDDLQQRPHQPLRSPRILVGIDATCSGDGVGEQAVGGGERDVRADAVRAVLAGTQPGGHRLAQPAFHPARGDGDEVASERVRRCGRQGVGKSGGEDVGAGGAMNVQHRWGG